MASARIVSTAATPCTTCGACCATFRVSFGCEELDAHPGGWVPSVFVELIDGGKGACMNGTTAASPRCAALRGTIGAQVECAIYDRRPSPCRAFAREAASGHGDSACGDARRLHGLPPLSGSYDAAWLC